MSLLLDTHTLLWSLKEPKKLSKELVARIQEEDFVYVSIASLWEIAIKVSLSKLEIPGSFDDLFPRYLHNAGFELPIETRHLSCVANLPLHHRDPFDRLIIAQTICDDLVIATCDPIINRYDVKTIW